jgi:hypothetical protein
MSVELSVVPSGKGSSRTWPLSLSTPNLIAGSAFVFGGPSALVLAALNWWCIDDEYNTKFALIGAAVATLFYAAAIQGSLGTAGRLVAFAANIVLLLVLRYGMASDIAAARTARPAARIVDAPWWRGALIGLGVQIGVFALAYVLSLVLAGAY